MHVFCRGDWPVIVFDKEGKFLNAWGKGVFSSPHGIFIDRDDTVYLSDDYDHTVRIFDIEGDLKMMLGKPGVAAETGYKVDESPVLFAGNPFNRVTNVARGRNGDLYISDGYGNARVHRFAADGTHLTSWGRPGSGPGEFNLPHSIAIDSAGRVYVADRENSRVQIFSRRWRVPASRGTGSAGPTTSSSTTRTSSTSRSSPGRRRSTTTCTTRRCSIRRPATTRWRG